VAERGDWERWCVSMMRAGEMLVVYLRFANSRVGDFWRG
jgi:hypothetical protein